MDATSELRILKRVKRVIVAWIGLALLIGSAWGQAWAGELTVMTYNVWGPKSPVLKRSWRLPEIARAVPSLDADVIAFQEAHTRKAGVLATIEGYPYHVWGNRRGWFGGDGLLLVSRYPIIESSWRSYSGCAWNDCFNRKGVLHARIRMDDGTEVDFFVTHVTAHAGNERHRYKQAQELWEFVFERRSPVAPFVLLGDFNTSPGSASYRFIRNWILVRDAHVEYADRHPDLPQEERLGYTWDPARNSNIRGNGRKYRLDYVFVKDGPGSRTVDVIESKVVLDGTVRGHQLSDHFAVRVRFRIGESVSAEE